MPIVVSCDACQSKMRVPDDRAGKQITCPKCGRAVQIPAVPLPSQIEPARPPTPQAPAAEEPAKRKGCLGMFIFGV